MNVPLAVDTRLECLARLVQGVQQPDGSETLIESENQGFVFV